MANHLNPKISEEQLVLYLDAGNVRSYGYGQLYGWGNNLNGQNALGFETDGLDVQSTAGNTLVPTAVGSRPLTPGPKRYWSYISSGNSMGAGIIGGELYTWGTNNVNRTGQNLADGILSSPTKVMGFNKWSSVECGNIHGIGIMDGYLYTWGSNGSGRTGVGSTSGTAPVPIRIGSDQHWAHVSASVSHSLAIGVGELYATGSNVNGRTGLNTITGNTLSFTKVGALNNWTFISAGITWSAGIAGGELYTWGNNADFRTGLNTSAGNTLVPTKVGSLNTWTWVSCGELHGAGIAGGNLYTWGTNANGRTGLNTTAGNSQVPTQVGSLNTWTRVSCTVNRTLAIAGGELYGFGLNSNGVTGQNTIAGNTLVPTQIGTANTWVEVDCETSTSAMALLNPGWLDLSNNGNDGIFENTGFSSESIGSIAFNGINSRVRGDLPFSGHVGNFTVSVWFKATDRDGFDGIIQLDGTGTGDYTGGIILSGDTDDDDDLRIRHWNDSGTSYTWSSPINVIGNWLNVTFVARTVSATKTLEVYQDGMQVVSPTTYTNNFQFAGKYRIGQYTWQTNYFEGLIGSVAIYQRALSVNEIVQNYRAAGRRFRI